MAGILINCCVCSAGRCVLPSRAIGGGTIHELGTWELALRAVRPCAGTAACEAESQTNTTSATSYLATSSLASVSRRRARWAPRRPQAKAFLHRVAAASGGSLRLVAQRYRNMTAAIAVALKKALANIEKRYLALCVNAPEG